MAHIRGLGPPNPHYPKRGKKNLGPYKITVKRKGWDDRFFTRDTLAAAEKCALHAEEDLDNGIDPYDRYKQKHSADTTTLEAFAELWLAAHFHEPSTRYNAELTVAKHILPVFGTRELTDGQHRIRPMEIDAWLGRLRRDRVPKTGRPLANATIRKIFGHLDGLLTAAVLEGHLAKNPCVGIVPPRVPKRPKVRPGHILTPAQVIAIAEVIQRPRKGAKPGAPVLERRRRFAILVIVLAWSGCRPEELRGLRRDEVHPLRRPAPTLTVVEPVKRGLVANPTENGPKTELYHGSPKSDAGQRDVELIQPVWLLIAELMANKRRYVFGTRNQTPFQAPDFQEIWDEAVTSLGHPEWRPYDLRRSHATWLKRAPRRALQERLGHEPQDVTDLYQDVEPEDRAEILTVLNRLWKEGQAGAALVAAAAAQ